MKHKPLEPVGGSSSHIKGTKSAGFGPTGNPILLLLQVVDSDRVQIFMGTDSPASFSSQSLGAENLMDLFSQKINPHLLCFSRGQSHQDLRKRGRPCFLVAKSIIGGYLPFFIARIRKKNHSITGKVALVEPEKSLWTSDSLKNLAPPVRFCR